jgi:hypothetical protein
VSCFQVLRHVVFAVQENRSVYKLFLGCSRRRYRFVGYELAGPSACRKHRDCDVGSAGVDRDCAVFVPAIYLGAGGCTLSSVEGAGWPNTLTPSRATYTESVIYNFAGGSEGALPLSALTAGSKGDEVQRRQLGVYGRLRHGVRADPGARAAHTRIA